MATRIKPLPIIERVVKEILENEIPGIRVGGELAYEGPLPYVYVSAVQGAGRNSKTEGLWYVDVDVFHDNFIKGMTVANEIEAIFFSGAYTTSHGTVDRILQSSPPTDVPWKDDRYFRLACTYSFRMRRSG